ncbi:MAG: NAD(P)-dependent oxidoreductase [Armatimonadota bacterium]|nr:NAD(P)-dependent oxidoreductase [Armatimonadota bacterium]
MKVLVTGGAGRVGRWVVRELLARGHEVTAAGRTPNVEMTGARYVTLDCTDAAQVFRVVGEHDTVVHLAAVPHPRRNTSIEIFRINCLGTYNVFEACAIAGIRKLAVASSINALGQFFGVKRLPVRYFPVDEAHPQLCSDPYSFSKKVTEEIAEYYWHRHGISSVCIRIPYVADPEGKSAAWLRQLRQENPFEDHFLVGNYWTWIDARDSARVFALGIEVEYEGAHVVFANDRVNCMGIPSRQLAARAYPEVTDWREPMEADEALVSCRRAKELLGWEPLYSWRGVAEGGAVPGYQEQK